MGEGEVQVTGWELLWANRWRSGPCPVSSTWVKQMRLECRSTALLMFRQQMALGAVSPSLGASSQPHSLGFHSFRFHYPELLPWKPSLAWNKDSTLTLCNPAKLLLLDAGLASGRNSHWRQYLNEIPAWSVVSLHLALLWNLNQDLYERRCLCELEWNTLG